MRKVDAFRDLEVYKGAFALQQAIFKASKKWPRNEDYSLTDQIRRSCRSVGANIAEAWAKRRYPAQQHAAVGRQLGSMIIRYQSFCF